MAHHLARAEPMVRPTPMAARTNVIERAGDGLHVRAVIEDAIENLIDLLDLIDGDEDLEEEADLGGDDIGL